MFASLRSEVGAKHLVKPRANEFFYTEFTMAGSANCFTGGFRFFEIQI